MNDDRGFAAELRRAMAAAGMTQGALADEIDASQSGVSNWLRGRTEPESTRQVMAAERALGLAPGALSRWLGWVPVDALPPPCTVPEAIAADEALAPAVKDALLEVYRRLRDS